MINTRTYLAALCISGLMAFTTPAIGAALVSGVFDCTVSVVDPPNGTGEPEADASVRISNVLGITSDFFSEFMHIGTGPGLEAVCEELATTFLNNATTLGCTAGPVQNVQFVGGNFTDNRWSFSLVCKGTEAKVVNAVGTLLEKLITVPAAAQTIRANSNEIRETSTSARGLDRQ